MTRIISELFATLDGVVSAPQDWHGPYWEAGMGERTEQLLTEADVMLLGRNTYLEHAAYWPGDTGTMADRMNAMPKLVVSATLTDPEWNNTTVASGLDAALATLGGRTAVVTGSVFLVRSLLAAGVLDELRLILDPLVRGEGVRLFDGIGELPLELIESVPHRTGAVTIRYATRA